MEQFRSDFVNKPKLELFLSYAKTAIQQEYMDRGKHKRIQRGDDDGIPPLKDQR